MSKRQKALLEITLVVFILAMVFMVWAATISAEAAPTTQHWHLPTGDDAWLITEPGCNLQPAPTRLGNLAYRLDETRLHWMQRERLVNWLVKQYRMTYQDARWTMADGLPIPSADAALVYDEQEQHAPAFLLHLVNVLCGKMLLATHNV